MKYQSFIVAIILLVGIAMPNWAEAYRTTDQQATLITDSLALYSITYNFGSPDHDLYLPARAKRGQVWDSDLMSVGYEIVEDGEDPVTLGTSVGVVISSAKLTEDELYYVPAGTASSFTFYTIFDTDPDATEADYAVQLTDFPYFRGSALERIPLTPSELQYYLTPELEFND